MIKFLRFKDTFNFIFFSLIIYYDFYSKNSAHLSLKRIVITGGPSTGKTTLINSLNLKGYTCFEEVIRKLTAEAQNSGDIIETHSNPIALVSDSELFNTKLLNLRVNDFKAAEQLDVNVSFFDEAMLVLFHQKQTQWYEVWSKVNQERKSQAKT